MTRNFEVKFSVVVEASAELKVVEKVETEFSLNVPASVKVTETLPLDFKF